MAVCSDDKPVESWRSCSCSDSSCGDKEPESGFYEEPRPHPRSDDESDEWISESELSSVCSNPDTAVGFSCRGRSNGTSTDGLTTPSDLSRNCESELQPVSLHLRPDFCLFCRDQALDNPAEEHNPPSHPTRVSADRDLKPVSVDQNPGPVGGKTPSAHEPLAPSVLPRLFEGDLPCVPSGQSPRGGCCSRQASAADAAPGVGGATPSRSATPKGEPALSSASDRPRHSASPKCRFAVLKRMRKFLSRIAACFRSRFCRKPSK